MLCCCHGEETKSWMKRARAPRSIPLWASGSSSQFSASSCLHCDTGALFCDAGTPRGGGFDLKTALSYRERDAGNARRGRGRCACESPGRDCVGAYFGAYLLYLLDEGLNQFQHTSSNWLSRNSARLRAARVCLEVSSSICANGLATKANHSDKARRCLL